jgi:hypothetical protein
MPMFLLESLGLSDLFFYIFAKTPKSCFGGTFNSLIG